MAINWWWKRKQGCGIIMLLYRLCRPTRKGKYISIRCNNIVIHFSTPVFWWPHHCFSPGGGAGTSEQMLRIYRSSGVVIKFVVVANRYSVWELLYAGDNIIRSNQWLIQLGNSIVRRLRYLVTSHAQVRHQPMRQVFLPSLTFAYESSRVPTILDVVVWATGYICRK